MKRRATLLAVALLTFAFGVLAWFVNPVRLLKHEPAEPLRITLMPLKPAYRSPASADSYLVTVENISTKTIRGYSLGQTCDCQSGGTYGMYPKGVIFSNPIPERQVLRPGESQTVPVPAIGLPFEKLKVWADLVHFTDGTNWGPNQGRTEGYVRE